MAIAKNDLENLFEAGLIFVIVILNAVVGVIQEQKAENALKNARIKSPALCMELERARLMWRIAYFRNQYNNTVYPAEPDKKEMTFLKDLISLQGK